MPGTGFVFHPDYLKHDTGAGHPEKPARVQAIHDHFVATGLMPRLARIEPTPASLETIGLVHPAGHIDSVRKACESAPAFLDPDTAVSAESFRVALLAVGGVIGACDAVMAGRVANAFCAVRPPGHHAEKARAMGFCLFNNVAIAARHLQKRHGLARIAIVDWDVHHGNGTEEIFAGDESVLYASTHQFPFYPGTGGESGHNILNLPLPPGTGDGEFLMAYQKGILPRLRSFRPDFLLISAGFDAHRDDPLAQLELSSGVYGVLTRKLKDAARELCGGRLVSALEGGYDLLALAESAERHVEALLE